MVAERERQQKFAGPLKKFEPRQDRGKLAKLAKEVLEKKESAGGAKTVKEVETDMVVPR